MAFRKDVGIVALYSANSACPIRFVGAGEQINDLMPFDRQTYAESSATTNVKNWDVHALAYPDAHDDFASPWHRASTSRAKASSRSQPESRVGCLIVKDGTILGEGSHQDDWRDHAEIVALKQTPRSKAERRGTLYVTLEPCKYTSCTWSL